ncbi:PP2C family protein-serine/threonine phosphatase [Paludibaculum fermentans]|uniref:SpoIIE family protein phosphatase n=1 Tax=Paludibaculum fermentans TaxID=1473598 RepID=A0A7S7SK33_PALFE|nr:SpoIIE family protein phosphatase [Paludibaculum fermentans]QOY87353.1 SpoIIE family protein phosphatase [Paludibaculum fermentans]
MAFSGWLNPIRSLGWIERLFAVFFTLSAILYWRGGLDSLPGLLLLLVTVFFGFATIWRVGVRLVRRAIWRLRNRLIVAYLFIAVVPILLLAVLTITGAWMISGQIAAYLLNMEMDRRVNSLRQTAVSLARVSAQSRAEAVKRSGFIFHDRYPGLQILVHDQDGKEVRYPEDARLEVPPPGHLESAGLVVRDKTFFLWAHTGGPKTEVVILVPVTRTFLQSLVPQLGDIQLAPIGLTAEEARELDYRLHPPVPEEAVNAATVAATGVPSPTSFLDFRLKWGVRLGVPVWEKPGVSRTNFLGVVTRISGPMKIVFSADTGTDVPSLLVFFTFCGIVFLVVEVISFYIGVSLSRTMTLAVHELYEATVHIREGDLTHRIQVNGNDQLAELGTSFNIMAGNLERLLQSEKERQKMQAELEIAREVQDQLHPKPMSGLGSLRVTSFCTAARMVSGDYFDYQTISDSQLALVIGDVAGKGISAALLMATLQSALRCELRHSTEMATAAAVGMGEGYAAPRVSPSQLVSNLNQHLYLSTAPEKYATFFFSVYDEVSSTLSYTNGGHLSPILVRDGKATLLDSNGLVVGAFPFAEYSESRVKLEAGDLLVCYTDGITEPENAYGEMFGEDRLIALLLAHADKDGAEIAARIVEEVTKWTASSELQDDMTLLLARKV